MKILHLIYTNGISGAEKYLRHLLPGLKAEGIDCELAIVCDRSAEDLIKTYASGMHESGIPAFVLTATRSTFIAAAKKISDYCRNNGINIIHSHLINSDLIAVLAKTIFNRKLKIISTKHGYDERVLQVYESGKPVIKKDFYYRMTKMSIRFIDKNIAVSHGIAELYASLKLSKSLFPVIHHGVDIQPFDREVYAETCRISDPQLIIVGRIETFKGHRYLVEALKDVVEEFPSCVLLILGEGSEKPALEKMAAELGLEKNIRFLGFQPHPYSYISNSDVIILPSLFEPFGLVYIEAFALKVPVVAFDTPAGNELMEDGVTARMVPKGDSKALAENIIRLLRDKQERERLASNAYDTYLAKFTTSTMIKKTAEWYKAAFL